MQIFFARMDEGTGSGLAGDLKLRMVHINCNNTSAPKRSCRDCAEAYAAAAEDCNVVLCSNTSACHRVVADC